MALAARLLLLMFGPTAHRHARTLERFVARLERRVECILCLRAMLRLVPARRRLRRPASLAPGFRRRRGSFRHFLRSCGLRVRNATPIARLMRLLAALADGRAYVAHFVRRLVRGVQPGGIVACAPPAILLSADAPRACAFRDSS